MVGKERLKVWRIRLNYNFFDKKGHFVYLTFISNQFMTDARHVLVMAFTKEGQLILTRHKKRGWEIPGGKVEVGEQPEVAAHRELYEETGVKVSSLKWIGQYVIDQPEYGEQLVKNIYLGQVSERHPLPKGFETTGCAPFPLDVLSFTKEFSPFIQDNVFPLCCQFIQK